jgi:hypothetical protein
MGFLLSGISSWMYVKHQIEGGRWMKLVSLGLYMGYIPFQCIYFERLIATFKVKGNVGFLLYIADSFGYLGSVLVMLGKEFFDVHVKWSDVYSHGVVIVSIIGISTTILSFFYFNHKYKLLKSAL